MARENRYHYLHILIIGRRRDQIIAVRLLLAPVTIKPIDNLLAHAQVEARIHWILRNGSF